MIAMEIKDIPFYKEGVEAYKAGIPSHRNPYGEPDQSGAWSEFFLLWNDGWHDASTAAVEEKKEQDDG